MTTTFSTQCSTYSPNEAKKTALAVLVQNQFKIVRRSAKAITLTGPGLRSTNQNPLLGATEVQLLVCERELRLEAVLGGVDTMQKFIFRFPLLLGLGLGAVLGIGSGVALGIAFGTGFGPPWASGWNWLAVALAIGIVPVSPWFVLSPLISKSILRRSCNALETLISNSCLMSEPTSD